MRSERGASPKFYDKLEKIKQEYKSENTNEKHEREVTKGVWRMPWLSEAKKDVTSCDKLRSGANIRLPVDIRMEESGYCN